MAAPTVITTAMTVAAKQAIPPRQAFAAILEKQASALSRVAASHISPVRMINIAVGAAMRQPLLFECDAMTVIRSLLQAAELGLEVGAANEAYLVPFKNNKRIDPATNKPFPRGIYECQLLQDYRGILKLVWQSEMIASVDYGVVYKTDRFKYIKGPEVILEHERDFDVELPERFWPARIQGTDEIDPSIPCRYNMIKCVWAGAMTTTGGKVAVVLSRSEVEKYRSMSRAKESTFWMEHWEAMGGRKTPLRQLCNLLPKSSQLMKAISLDDAVERGDFTGLAFDIPEANFEPEPGDPGTIVPAAAGENGSGANGAGMEGAKASLKEKLVKAGDHGKAANDLAAAAKLFDLDKEKIAEITTSLAAINGGPAYDEFLIQAVKDGLQGFSQLLARLNELRQADQGGDGQRKLV